MPHSATVLGVGSAGAAQLGDEGLVERGGAGGRQAATPLWGGQSTAFAVRGAVGGGSWG